MREVGILKVQDLLSALKAILDDAPHRAGNQSLLPNIELVNHRSCTYDF